jgi:ribonuclease P protein component
MGVSVSARLGKAVIRNKLRRRVKEAFKRVPREELSGQFVFIVRRTAGAASFQDLLGAVRGLVKRMEAQ